MADVALHGEACCCHYSVAFDATFARCMRMVRLHVMFCTEALAVLVCVLQRFMLRSGYGVDVSDSSLHDVLTFCGCDWNSSAQLINREPLVLSLR